MLLYLLRHADADTVPVRGDDRPLSEKGKGQAKDVARFCKENEVAPALILSSPLLRAHETAQPVAETLKVPVTVVPWLDSGMRPETALEELKAYRSHPGVMIVGHEPDFSALVAHLVGLPSPTLIHVRKGSLTAVQIDVLRAGAGRLEFSIPCKMM